MSIYKRGKTWWADITGMRKRIRVSLRTSDEEEALKIEQKLRDTLPGIAKKDNPWKFDSKWINERMAAMRHRSKQRGFPCMTRSELETLIQRSGGRCELSGIAFEQTIVKGCKRAPFAPSVDRIDHRKGYTLENCRLICFGLNVALNQWGESVFRHLAVGFLGHNFGHYN